jgi:hypothetical protein
MACKRLIAAVLGLVLAGCTEPLTAPRVGAVAETSLGDLRGDPFVRLLAARIDAPELTTTLDAALSAPHGPAATSALGAARERLEAMPLAPREDGTRALLQAALTLTLDRVAAALAAPGAIGSP